MELHVTFVVPKVLKWLQDFWNICGSLAFTKCGSFMFWSFCGNISLETSNLDCVSFHSFCFTFFPVSCYHVIVYNHSY